MQQDLVEQEASGSCISADHTADYKEVPNNVPDEGREQVILALFDLLDLDCDRKLQREDFMSLGQVREANRVVVCQAVL